MAKRETRSPLKDKPLRRPGQSLWEERSRIIEDKVEPWALMALCFFAMAGMEWFRYFRPIPPSPWLFTAVALGILVFAFWRYVRWWPRLQALKLGIEGERVVGEYLDRLRERGFRVFHDVVAEGFNIDHVLIGPQGVFTIETKTRSKPTRGDARVKFDGETLTVAGFEPERDAVAQAKGQARWLSSLIADTTERRQFVRPVILFPGWFVESPATGASGIWVLEPKALPAFIDAEASPLSKEDVAVLSKCVSMHVRAFERLQDRK